MKTKLLREIKRAVRARNSESAERNAVERILYREDYDEEPEVETRRLEDGSVARVYTWDDTPVGDGTLLLITGPSLVGEVRFWADEKADAEYEEREAYAEYLPNPADPAELNLAKDIVAHINATPGFSAKPPWTKDYKSGKMKGKTALRVYLDVVPTDKWVNDQTAYYDVLKDEEGEYILTLPSEDYNKLIGAIWAAKQGKSSGLYTVAPGTKVEVVDDYYVKGDTRELTQFIKGLGGATWDKSKKAWKMATLGDVQQVLNVPGVVEKGKLAVKDLGGGAKSVTLSADQLAKLKQAPVDQDRARWNIWGVPMESGDWVVYGDGKGSVITVMRYGGSPVMESSVFNKKRAVIYFDASGKGANAKDFTAARIWGSKKIKQQTYAIVQKYAELGGIDFDITTQRVFLRWSHGEASLVPGSPMWPFEWEEGQQYNARNYKALPVGSIFEDEEDDKWLVNIDLIFTNLNTGKQTADIGVASYDVIVLLHLGDGKPLAKAKAIEIVGMLEGGVEGEPESAPAQLPKSPVVDDGEYAKILSPTKYDTIVVHYGDGDDTVWRYEPPNWVLWAYSVEHNAVLPDEFNMVPPEDLVEVIDDNSYPWHSAGNFQSVELLAGLVKGYTYPALLEQGAAEAEEEEDEDVVEPTGDWATEHESICGQLKVIPGTQKGSNKGGQAKDAAGNLYYVKFMTKARAANEALANWIYNQFKYGEYNNPFTHAPDSRACKVQGKWASVAPWIPGFEIPPKDAYWKGGDYLAESFVIDAWLANWDVVGLNYDNLLKRPMGEPQVPGAWLRVDNGGALLYRAQGTPKGADFNDQVTELTTMLLASKNPQTAKVFEYAVTPTGKQLMKKGVERIVGLFSSAYKVKQAGLKLGMTGKAANEVASMLSYRLDFLEKFVGLPFEEEEEIPAGEWAEDGDPPPFPQATAPAGLVGWIDTGTYPEMYVKHASGKWFQYDRNTLAWHQASPAYMDDMWSNFSWWDVLDGDELSLYTKKPSLLKAMYDGLAKAVVNEDEGMLQSMHIETVDKVMGAGAQDDGDGQWLQDMLIPGADAAIPTLTPGITVTGKATAVDTSTGKWEWVTDGAGERWLRVSGLDEARYKAAAGAVALYQLVGAKVAPVVYDATGLYAKVPQGYNIATTQQDLLPYLDAFGAEFPADAWVANWAMPSPKGGQYFQVAVKTTGEPGYLRLPPIGALNYRWSGANKALPPEVGELETMRNANQNATSAWLFSKAEPGRQTQMRSLIGGLTKAGIRKPLAYLVPKTVGEAMVKRATFIGDSVGELLDAAMSAGGAEYAYAPKKPTRKPKKKGPWAAAGALITDGYRVLLVRRSSNLGETRKFTSKSAESGTWALPGGAVDKGETPSDAALRETIEELGHAPAGMTPTGITLQASFAGHPKGPLTFHTIVYKVTPTNADHYKPMIKGSHAWETDGWAWVPLNEFEFEGNTVQWRPKLHTGIGYPIEFEEYGPKPALQVWFENQHVLGDVEAFFDPMLGTIDPDALTAAGIPFQNPRRRNPPGYTFSGVRYTQGGKPFIEYRPRLKDGTRPRIRISIDASSVGAAQASQELREVIKAKELGIERKGKLSRKKSFITSGAVTKKGEPIWPVEATPAFMGAISAVLGIHPKEAHSRSALYKKALTKAAVLESVGLPLEEAVPEAPKAAKKAATQIAKGIEPRGSGVLTQKQAATIDDVYKAMVGLLGKSPSRQAGTVDQKQLKNAIANAIKASAGSSNKNHEDIGKFLRYLVLARQSGLWVEKLDPGKRVVYRSMDLNELSGSFTWDNALGQDQLQALLAAGVPKSTLYKGSAVHEASCVRAWLALQSKGTYGGVSASFLRTAPTTYEIIAHSQFAVPSSASLSQHKARSWGLVPYGDAQKPPSWATKPWANVEGFHFLYQNYKYVKYGKAQPVSHWKTDPAGYGNGYAVKIRSRTCDSAGFVMLPGKMFDGTKLPYQSEDEVMHVDMSANHYTPIEIVKFTASAMLRDKQLWAYQMARPAYSPDTVKIGRCTTQYPYSKK